MADISNAIFTSHLKLTPRVNAVDEFQEKKPHRSFQIRRNFCTLAGGFFSYMYIYIKKLTEPQNLSRAIPA